MKAKKALLFILIIICSVYEMYAQPGESDKKHNIHEIKLHEREDGSKVGAITWTTASPENVQKFVIRKLSIMEPVQVLLQSLSPNDEVTLQFVKQNWDQPESSISAKGKKMGKKIFRTYQTAAMKISAQKAGIPYLLIVQVGKKLPSYKAPIFRITNDKEEYENYLKNKGETSENQTDADSAVIPVTNNESGGGNTPNNSSLLYIIIGLLAVMVAFLGYFVFFRKGSKKILLFVLLIGLCINTLRGQSDAPTPMSTEEINNMLGLDDVLAPQDGDIPIIEYGSPEWYDENPIPIDESERVMTEDEFKKMVLDMREDYLDFKRDFVDDMPGEGTEGGVPIIPPGISEEDLNRLKSRIRNLERQVAFLSERDRNYAPPDERNEEQIIVFCESNEECMECILKREEDVAILQDKFRDLNNILTYNDWVMETGIATGNNLANMAPGFALGWQQQLINIQISRKELWIEYHNKYDELMDRLDNVENGRASCNEMFNADQFAFDWRESVKDQIRMETPEMVTPIF